MGTSSHWSSHWSYPVAAAVSISLLASCGLAREPERTLVRNTDDTLLVMKDPRISESSGLAPSALHPGVFYTHNDKGSGPEVFAVGEDGSVAAVIDLVGAPSTDWEDISVTPDGQVWVADIGGSDDEGRSEISLIWFREPDQLADAEAEWLEFALVYEDGPHDAEALLVDPDGRRKYIVTKDSPVGGIYAAPKRLSRNKPNVLERIGDAPPNITSGSFAPEGERIALRNYARAFLLESLDDQQPVAVELPYLPQGESLVVLEDGDLLIGSEGTPSEVVRIRTPADWTR